MNFIAALFIYFSNSLPGFVLLQQYFNNVLLFCNKPNKKRKTLQNHAKSSKVKTKTKSYLSQVHWIAAVGALFLCFFNYFCFLFCFVPMCSPKFLRFFCFGPFLPFKGTFRANRQCQSINFKVKQKLFEQQSKSRREHTKNATQKRLQ